MIAAGSRLGVGDLCRLFDVARSGLYEFRSRVESPRARRRREAGEVIQKYFDESHRTYGYRRIRVLLSRAGIPVNRKTVAAIMRERGLKGRKRGRYVPRTTDSDHDCPVAANLLPSRPPTRPDAVWQTDITYINTAEGWMYLAAMVDGFTRRVVGWAIAPNMETSLVLRALDNAVSNRRPPAGLLHHSDRGSQYASEAYRDRLRELGFVASMSRRGNCYDNALTESLWSTLKLEWLHRRTFTRREEVEQAVFKFIDGWYNPRRLHSSLGYLSPVDFEKSLLN